MKNHKYSSNPFEDLESLKEVQLRKCSLARQVAWAEFNPRSDDSRIALNTMFDELDFFSIAPFNHPEHHANPEDRSVDETRQKAPKLRTRQAQERLKQEKELGITDKALWEMKPEPAPEAQKPGLDKVFTLFGKAILDGCWNFAKGVAIVVVIFFIIFHAFAK